MPTLLLTKPRNLPELSDVNEAERHLASSRLFYTQLLDDKLFASDVEAVRERLKKEEEKLVFLYSHRAKAPEELKRLLLVEKHLREDRNRIYARMAEQRSSQRARTQLSSPPKIKEPKLLLTEDMYKKYEELGVPRERVNQMFANLAKREAK